MRKKLYKAKKNWIIGMAASAVILSKQSITIRLGAVDQSPYTEDIRFSTGGFLYGREA